MADAAAAKARKLLEKFLTAEQLENYQQTNRFAIIDAKRGRRYVIGNDLQVRVYDHPGLHEHEPPRETWCVRLADLYTPKCDSLLAQLLMLRDSPGKLRKAAVVTRRRGRRDLDYTHLRRILEQAGYAPPRQTSGEAV